ncbi:MAG: hypothetical protein PHF60_00355 [Candidatus ainarchaeum sp.]|nr:hypothetical protein [Candidatus ainarchaeum sp.]
MNIVSYIQKINSVGKYLLVAVLALNILSLSFAQSAIGSALKELCNASQTFLGGAIMIMILLAGATYALGQVLGAETRARATVWATAMMTGALIGALIYLLTPIIIKTLLPSASYSFISESTNPCNF